MSRIENVNANRLQACCQEFGISLDALAEKLAISPHNIAQVMAGVPGLTFLQLKKIADYFGRGVLFFLEAGPVDTKTLHSSQFRTLNNQKADLSPKFRKLIERVERQRRTFLDLREELGEPRVTFQPPKIPMSPHRAAEIARKWLGLETEKTFDQYRTAVEQRGVLVFRSNGFAGAWQVSREDAICGFSLYFERWPVIFARKEDAPVRQTFTLMHELGHLLLHRDSFVDAPADLRSYQGKEKAANDFAGALLVPESILEDIGDTGRPHDVADFDRWLGPVRKQLGVSLQVILIRLLRTGRLPQPVYDAWWKWKQQVRVNLSDGGNRQYRYREPNHLFGEPYVRTVLESLQRKNITLTKASAYLDNLKIPDLHKLERFYADA